jgi:histidinol phosphatase-like PHP family hydrolase
LKKRSHRDETSKTNETNKREDKQIKLDAIVAEIEKLQELCAKNEKFLEINKRKVGEARAAKEENDRAKEALKTELQVVTEAYETKKKSVDEDRKEIEQKKRERDLLNKDVAYAEEKGKE